MEDELHGKASESKKERLLALEPGYSSSLLFFSLVLLLQSAWERERSTNDNYTVHKPKSRNAERIGKRAAR